MRIEYGLFNLIIAVMPMIGGLLYNKTIFPQKKPLAISIALGLLIFVTLEQFLTNVFWWFSDKYTVGLMIGVLPIEEVLFFISVPWATLLLWLNVNHLLKKSAERVIFSRPVEYLVLTILSICSFLFFYVFFRAGLYYSSLVFILLLLVIIFDQFIGARIIFWRNYLLFQMPVILLTTIWNGYLTARPVVIYNVLLKSNIQVFTIPIEDYLYGFVLLTFIISLYERLRKK